MKSSLAQIPLRMALMMALFLPAIYSAHAQTAEPILGDSIVETYYDGLDTIYVYADDSVDYNGMRITKYNSLYLANTYNARLGGTSSIYDITIKPGHLTKGVNEGMLGFHVEGMFNRKHLPNDSTSWYGWDLLSETTPKVLRFPGGSSSKFMHLLDSTSAGYGYDLDEIIRFYDHTDGIVNAPPTDSILAHLVEIAYQDDWVFSSEVDDFINFGEDWVEQENYVDSGHLFINDFIELVERIETNNPDHRVDVIVCLNILSEPASVCREIVEYVRDNDIFDLNVVGVEMGNEVYFKWGEKIMGWYYFQDYYDYLNGIQNDSLDSVVVGNAVWEDHDYIVAFKGDPDFECKVGIPAENLSGDYAFRKAYQEGPRAMDEWNDSLSNHYKDKLILLGEDTIIRKKFDAVILHPYYDFNNWESILKNNLETSYVCNNGDADTTNDEWTFYLFDERLEVAFDSLTLNFRDLYKTEYIESFDQHNLPENLNFGLNNGNAKDLWVTESNIKLNPETGLDELRPASFAQGFLHGTLIQEWFLKNLKLNFDPDYRMNFFTYVTWQNFEDGSVTNFLSGADERERDFFGVDVLPYDGFDNEDSSYRNYYLKRTTYFTMLLLSEITKKHLEYLPGTFVHWGSHPNYQPTTFIDPDKENLYIYFTNVMDYEQHYILNTINTEGLYDYGGILTIDDTATIYCIDALKPYSTSGKGKNTLYDLNTCYDTIGIDYPIEITGIDTILNTPSCGTGVDPWKCLVVPPYSFGYIKIPIYAEYSPRLTEVEQLYDVTIYPNPTSDMITVVVIKQSVITNDQLTFKIIDMQGNIIKKGLIKNGMTIPVYDMSNGVYEIVINFEDNTLLVKQFVKQ